MLLYPNSEPQGYPLRDVHDAMVVILAMGIGLLAPPFGLGFYAACAALVIVALFCGSRSGFFNQSMRASVPCAAYLRE
jgi:hypothetical protein